MSKRFTLYGHFLSAPSYRVGLMLSLCDEPFSYVHVDLRNGEQKKPDYLAKNRYGQVPCLHDGKQHFCQSSSILQYLAETLGKFGGRDAADHAHIREWMFWDFDRFSPPLLRSRAIAAGLFKAEPPTVAMFKEQGEAALKVLDGWLGNHAWLVDGAPTVADVAIYPAIHYAPAGGFEIASYPNVAAWQQRMQTLPGFGTPDEVLPKESRG